MTAVRAAAIAAWLAAGLITGAGAPALAAGERATVHVRGSNSLLPVARTVAEAYMAEHPGEAVVVSGGDSGPGLKALLDGTADIAMISSAVPEEVRKRAAALKATLVVEPVAVDGIVPVVHPGNPAPSLSLKQIGAIYAGAVTNWRTVGGPDAPITLLSLPSSSGTADAWRHGVLGEAVQTPKAQSVSAAQMKAVLAADPHAIGYLGMGTADGALKALPVDGVAASRETVRDGRFPIRREMALVTRGDSGEAARRFVAYFRSPAARALVEAAGLQPANP
ncbi:phosphate ABC transporter substrate-binding protein [Azospirillum sp. SYSU D00513]|uniref:substrate-binding domain-containing protein n=1 Tax=Azospirillum sp. SYSU D00513 TaxID=2812561 RepID=UPI001A9602CF